MVNTSQDILYLVTAFCVLWLTLFVSWLLFYVIMVVKHLHDLIRSVRAKIEFAAELLASIKEKIEHSASALSLLMQSIGKVVEYVVEKKQTARAPKRKTSS